MADIPGMTLNSLPESLDWTQSQSWPPRPIPALDETSARGPFRNVGVTIGPVTAETRSMFRGPVDWPANGNMSPNIPSWPSISTPEGRSALSSSLSDHYNSLLAGLQRSPAQADMLHSTNGVMQSRLDQLNQNPPHPYQEAVQIQQNGQTERQQLQNNIKSNLEEIARLRGGMPMTAPSMVGHPTGLRDREKAILSRFEDE